ncbi:hypothetical protein BY458DRAFT_514345, partial [Sporodiniella umbellata]
MDEHYICQRAANAIISEIGPFRVSTDALQNINQFLDEFVGLILTSSLSLDLSDIKTVVFSLLPSTLGKNAIVEAELEVKTFAETESIDFEQYERMRLIEKDQFPVEDATVLLKEKCFEYCTLADKEDQLYLQKSIQKRSISIDEKIAISPIIAIYVTTVMEHIAEYLLTAVAISCEHEDTDYARIKEVYIAIVDDMQLGSVFNSMRLKEKMEKRLGIPNKLLLSVQNRKSFHSVTTPNHENTQNKTGSILDISFSDSVDLELSDENLEKYYSSSASLSIPSQPNTPTYINNNRKSTYHVLKNNRKSFNNIDGKEYVTSGSSIYDPDSKPTMDFDDLVRSGGTVKVSLTPNRLKHIEIKNLNQENTAPELTWERRSISSPRASTQTMSQTPKSSNLSRNISQARESPSEPPKTLKTVPLSSSKSVLVQYENPQELPKQMDKAVLEKRPQMSQCSTLSSISSSSSNESFSSSSSSDPSTIPVSLSTNLEKQSPVATVQESPTTKSSKITPIEGPILRRSSVSSRKSRENLRRIKSLEGTQTETEKAPDLPEKKEKEIPQVPLKDTAERTPEPARQQSSPETYVHEKYNGQINNRGSVSSSIKQWDDILKSEEPLSIPPAAKRRSLLRQMRQQQLQGIQSEKETGTSNNAVLNKVLQFERVSEDILQNRVSILPRRERFFYLQQDPSTIERKSAALLAPCPQGIDQGTQTENLVKEKEEGTIEGDEEWFLQDGEWEEQEEACIVEWLLC